MDKARARVLFMPVIIGVGSGGVYVQNGGNCTKAAWAGCTGEFLDADGRGWTLILKLLCKLHVATEAG